MSEALEQAAQQGIEALELAMDNLREHGDNCFLHDEGEYNSCFCGKDSLISHLQSTVEGLAIALSQPAPLAGEVTDEQIETWSFWEEFPGYLINNYEGITITEEVLQQAASGLYAKLKADGRAILALRPQAVPMTDDEMWYLWNWQGIDDMNQSEAIAFARAVEAHHGILPQAEGGAKP